MNKAVVRNTTAVETLDPINDVFMVVDEFD
jgi:hypothetical protein